MIRLASIMSRTPAQKTRGKQQDSVTTILRPWYGPLDKKELGTCVVLDRTGWRQHVVYHDENRSHFPLHR